MADSQTRPTNVTPVWTGRDRARAWWAAGGSAPAWTADLWEAAGKAILAVAGLLWAALGASFLGREDWDWIEALPLYRIGSTTAIVATVVVGGGLLWLYRAARAAQLREALAGLLTYPRGDGRLPTALSVRPKDVLDAIRLVEPWPEFEPRTVRRHYATEGAARDALEALGEAVRTGNRMAIVSGPSLMGKSRVALEVARRMPAETLVLRLDAAKLSGEQGEALAALGGRRVLWILDNLNYFSEQAGHLLKLLRDAERATDGRSAAIATCTTSHLAQLGADANPVLYEVFKGMAHFELVRLNADAVARLAERTGKAVPGDAAGSPGLLLLSFEERQRDRASFDGPTRDVYDAGVAMSVAGVQPIRVPVVRGVVEDLLGRPLDEGQVRDILRDLKERQFLRRADPVEAEDALVDALGLRAAAVAREPGLVDALANRRRVEEVHDIALAHGHAGDYECALAGFERAIACAPEAPDVVTEAVVAGAFYHRGVALGKLERPAEAIPFYKEVVSRFGSREELALLERVASALVNQGVDTAEVYGAAAALPIYAEVVSRFGDREEPALLKWVAMALFNQGIATAEVEGPAAAIPVYAEVVSRFGDREEPALLEWVAMALGSQGVATAEAEGPASAIPIFAEVVSRFGDREEPALLEQVARALAGKALTAKMVEGPAAGIAQIDALLDRFGNREEPKIREVVELARTFRAQLTDELDSPDSPPSTQTAPKETPPQDMPSS